jgi:hypothetical protein
MKSKKSGYGSKNLAKAMKGFAETNVKIGERLPMRAPKLLKGAKIRSVF